MKAQTKLFLETDIGNFGFVTSKKGLKAVIGPENQIEKIEDIVYKNFGSLAEDHIISEGLAQDFRKYCQGFIKSFNYELDTDGYTEFQSLVWNRLRLIPYGTVTTYGKIATDIKRPNSARAVGQAVGSNPFIIVVPCHRVVGADGSLTGFGHGLDFKERLLLLEGIADASAQKIKTENRKNFKPAKRSTRTETSIKNV
jgi:methylated-DNA-[protein]-cysteine S-methyltransferase|tara:strand:- start:122 stop:715 length:594 start_codon:yes stop_codon:yes gene_type:complete